ncbi:Sec63 [Myotisia sp. PD_48]|nr:Sec63 [Myotisia sp. PD_48]
MTEINSSEDFCHFISSFKTSDVKRNRGGGSASGRSPQITAHHTLTPITQQRHVDSGYLGPFCGPESADALVVEDTDAPFDGFGGVSISSWERYFMLMNTLAPDRELLSQLPNRQPASPNPNFRRNEFTSWESFSQIQPSIIHKSNNAASPTRGLLSSPARLDSPSSPSRDTRGNRPKAFHEAEHDIPNSNPWRPPRNFSCPDVPSPLYSSATIKPACSPEHRPTYATPMIQGIRLVSTRELPDRFRSIFPFPVFNAIQSKCFPAVYHENDNVVLSAPTGSGKTIIMELAICRLVANLKDSRFKIVYQAPTKSLCSERLRDWRPKFAPFDLQCAELTGDTDHFQLRSVQNASIIITTPEKWDSMTRKWKDHMKLMQLVKLFLIDEVHILKEVRGATLEAVVSRMKSVGSDVRFVALSATIPNSQDIAHWLGKDSTNQHLPAHREKFGEEFRPVKLQKFVYGYQGNGNDFAFDRVCENKLPEVLAKHSCKKPIMIFCCTRNSAISTAKNLASLWSSATVSKRLWNGPTKLIQVQNHDLRALVFAGVAFHHAGLDSTDRQAVEMGYLEGQISVICCTSTLAVGVNLPCQLVVIKNTVTWQDNSCKPYADLEMMQMLGRAGRPQFDDSAIAVILTRKEKVDHYQKLVAGSEQLESCLHLNLIDHLNSEIGLGTVNNLTSAVKWLESTFFFVRLQRNPTYYKLKEGGSRADEQELLRQICEKNIESLQELSLITSQPPLRSTDLGDAMARYYIKFDTMKIFLSLPARGKISEILSVVAQADEYREVRLKSGEKSLYKEINKGNGIRFPIKSEISLPAHKISLLIQAELGAVELPSDEQYQKHKLSLQQDKSLVFSHVNRIIRCIIDCQISRGDSVGTRHALDLSRSLGARVWDESPFQMKQIEQIGVVAVRKLTKAGINSIEALEMVEPLRIETLLSRNPPFGMKILAKVADFPKPRVLNQGIMPRIKFKVDIGFINAKVPTHFLKRQIYLCFLAETSDGRIIDFRRFSASKLQKEHQILLSTELHDPYQTILCSVMCDQIAAGTMRQAELKPGLPKSCFPACKENFNSSNSQTSFDKKRSKSTHNANSEKKTFRKDSDEFGDNQLDDTDFLAEEEKFDFYSLHELDTLETTGAPHENIQPKTQKVVSRGSTSVNTEPIPLENGKWACNHRCKDKTTDGVDRPPKPAKKQAAGNNPSDPKKQRQGTISTIRDAIYKPPIQSKIEFIDLTEDTPDYTEIFKNEISKTCKSNKKAKSMVMRTQNPATKVSNGNKGTIDPLQLSLFDFSTTPNAQNNELDGVERLASPEKKSTSRSHLQHTNYCERPVCISSDPDVGFEDDDGFYMDFDNAMEVEIQKDESDLAGELTDYDTYIENFPTPENNGKSRPDFPLDWNPKMGTSNSSPSKSVDKFWSTPITPSPAKSVLAAIRNPPSGFNTGGGSLFYASQVENKQPPTLKPSQSVIIGKRNRENDLHVNDQDQTTMSPQFKKGKPQAPLDRDPEEAEGREHGVQGDRQAKDLFAGALEGIDPWILEEFKDVAEFY